MAQQRWYPPPGHPREDTDRIIFDNLYTLLEGQQAPTTKAADSKGMSLTAAHPVAFQVGSESFGGLIFKDGILVGVNPATATGDSSSSQAIVRNSAASGPAVPLSASGAPSTSTPVPSAPVVASLPLTGSALAVVGTTVIYNGQPYIYTAGLSGPPGYWALDVTGAPAIRDLWGNISLYPPANYPLGTVFTATDRQVAYAIQFPGGVATWIYYNGIYEAPLASIPTDLGVTSKGFTFRASDYLHSWIWSGSAWSLTTGGFSPGSIFFFATAAYVPNFDALWQLCDGSTVPVSQNNATLVNVMTPVAPNNYMVR